MTKNVAWMPIPAKSSQSLAVATSGTARSARSSSTDGSIPWIAE